MIPPEATASQPIPTGKRHKYHLPPGFNFPDPADIFPCELSNADERRVLFVDAMFRHGQKSWWQRSKRLNARPSLLHPQGTLTTSPLSP